MKAHGSLPNRYTYPSDIKACCNMSKVWNSKLVHGSTLRCGVDGDVFIGTCLIEMYGKCGEIGDAWKVFDGMSVRSVISWTAMVVPYVM
ncbi:putative pentatricopeptide [Lupinus albus]|uniref:Putative pentatricopeptide n=1 Tax=Lupinus albus TaxID=3870 RepID=A0A6A4NI07_LUPAL|nr:putative pentatricopeptide [Lupinus albus]